jgi:citrate synthase
VTASTRADIYGAATSAVATLEGDLHGGAPGKVMKMMLEIGNARARRSLRARAARARREDHGHGPSRVQSARPARRASRDDGEALTEASDPEMVRDRARARRRRRTSVLHEEKPGKRIYANVEFYTAPTLYSLGIPADEFTCMFACGRMAGWTAHVLEQMATTG